MVPYGIKCKVYFTCGKGIVYLYIIERSKQVRSFRKEFKAHVKMLNVYGGRCPYPQLACSQAYHFNYKNHFK